MSRFERFLSEHPDYISTAALDELRRSEYSRLDTQQQALIMGHAVPMPVVVKTREYGPELYAAVGVWDADTTREKRQAAKSALYGDDE